MQGNSVRAAFEMGTAALAGTAPSARMLHPAAEAAKFILLPAPPPARASAGGRLSMPPPPPRDPHEAVLFPPGSLSHDEQAELLGRWLLRDIKAARGLLAQAGLEFEDF